MRRSNTPSKKQGPKQSASVLALMTNYPPSSSNGVATRNEKCHDMEDKMVSKFVDGKQMIKLEPELTFLPHGSWKEYPNSNLPKQYYHITTAFDTTSMRITCSSGADFFSVQCTGVTALKVMFRDDDMITGNNMSQSLNAEKRRFSRNSRSHVDEISIPSHQKVLGGDPAEERLQEISFRSPWPCCHVEVLFTGRERGPLFLSVLHVAVYGESLPSGLSTPIDMLKR